MAPVVLVDSWLPRDGYPAAQEPEPSADDEERELAIFLRHLGLPSERLEEVRRAVRTDATLDEAWDDGTHKTDVFEGAPGQRLGKLFAAYRSHARALRSYDPHRPDGVEPSVALFQAMGPERREGLAAEGWRRLLGPEIPVVDLPGDHFSLLQGETVERLAAGIRRHWRSRDQLAGSAEAAKP